MYVMWGQGGDTSIKASVFGVDPIELGSVTRGGHIEWYCVPPHGSNGSAITKSTGCFSTDYFDKAIPSKRIIVFLFDSSSIYPGKWDSVKQNNIYVRKYILNYDSLELRGWKIVYL